MRVDCPILRYLSGNELHTSRYFCCLMPLISYFAVEPVRTEERPKAIPAPGVTISSLIEKVASYAPKGTEELIAEAYNVAHAAHRGQTRKSGEPFVYHPLATADVLAELRLDPTTIAAALLHDVLEDS